MVRFSRVMLLASVLALPAAAFAQSASGVGTAGSTSSAHDSAATAGSGGSGAAGETSASSLGTAGTSTNDTSTGSSMALGGSAAGPKASSQAKVNPNASNGHAKAMANAGGGEWSKSMTHTKDHNGEVSSRTRSMSHEPGSAPAKSDVEATAPQ